MDIESCTTTFNLDKIWATTLSLFVDTLNENRGELKSPYSNPALFVFYEDFISYPIDDLKDENDANRLDFYEAISLMSWALYREWTRKVVDENEQLDCFSILSKDNVIKLFLDNLNCEEGISLLNKIMDKTSPRSSD
jgi:hypothetical protein